MKPLIVANWKMNPTNSKEALDLALEVAKGVKGLDADVVLCPPFVYIPQLVPSENVFIGAQDCFWENKGAYTGEVSPQMLKNLGCTYVVLGHSERRQLGETLAMVNQKVKAALSAGLFPIVCIGEEVEKEMSIVFQGIENWKLEIKNLILVYEPLWAISTSPNGHPATPADMRRAVGSIRRFVLGGTPILYGGSVDSGNIRSFLGSDLAQGALVGAASLNAKEFVSLVKNVAMG